MIDLKQAVAEAERFVRDLYSADELHLLRLEEADLTDDERTWRITLGWVERARQSHTPFLGQGQSNVVALPRVYKTILVDAESGRAKFIKIREV